MSRADDLKAVQLAAAQFPSMVRTAILQGIEIPADVKHHDETVADLEYGFARVGDPVALHARTNSAIVAGFHANAFRHCVKHGSAINPARDSGRVERLRH